MFCGSWPARVGRRWSVTPSAQAPVKTQRLRGEIQKHKDPPENRHLDDLGRESLTGEIGKVAVGSQAARQRLQPVGQENKDRDPQVPKKSEAVSCNETNETMTQQQNLLNPSQPWSWFLLLLLITIILMILMIIKIITTIMITIIITTITGRIKARATSPGQSAQPGIEAARQLGRQAGKAATPSPPPKIILTTIR